MFLYKEPPIVISVGGSLIVPNGGIDTDFVKKLNIFIREEVEKGKRFFLVAGGGKLSRTYRDAGKAVIGSLTNEDLDWLGIHATRMNAHLLRTIFQDIAHPRIIQDYSKRLRNVKEPVVIASGWKPGWSTDYCMVKVAQMYKGQVMINLSNIDWIYDKDPNKYKDAKIIKKLTWEDCQDLVGSKWMPGMNTPFDPIATTLAKSLHLTAIVANGRNFDNLRKIIEGEEFTGTVILPYEINAGFYDRQYYHGKKSGYVLYTRESFLGRLFQNVSAFYRAVLIKLFLNPKTCLDVGCGTGRLIRILRWLKIDAHGSEISKTALELITDSIKPYVKEGDILNLPYKDNEFDLVTSFDVLEHVERSKIRQAVKETIRVSNKHILHKIYTLENTWIRLFHRRDFSRISVFRQEYWLNIFGSYKQVSSLSKAFFQLPSFFESVFVLKKKK
ncbi:MAG: UMP kinase [Patescibacteria group bacterium]